MNKQILHLALPSAALGCVVLFAGYQLVDPASTWGIVLFFAVVLIIATAPPLRRRQTGAALRPSA